MPAPGLRDPQLGGGEIDLAGSAAARCGELHGHLVPAVPGRAAGDDHIATRYEDTGLVVLAVDIREDEAAVGAFMEALG